MWSIIKHHRDKAFRILPIIVFLFFAPGEGQSRHIIGGEITYECIGIDTVLQRVTYRFTMKIYRDCASGGAVFDNPAEIGIYRGGGNNYRHIPIGLDPFTVPLRSSVRLDPQTNNPCLIVPPNICVEEGTYVWTYTLPIIDESYLIAYQRCCRNNTITNIIDPWDAGAAYTVEITPEAQRSCNNSPVFNEFPPIIICADEPLQFDHSATDAEGDQLVYEFCAPLNGAGPFGTMQNPGDPRACNGVTPNPIPCPPPYPPVDYKLPAYSAVNPMGGNPQVMIDPNTGRITGTPINQGQFVVGVCVKEYRNGQLIGSLRRDFQFNVAYCEPTVVAELEADAVIGNDRFVINSCGNNTVDFVNASYNPQYIREYNWQFLLNNDTLKFNTRDITVTFPGVGQYTGTMILNPGTECSDTAEISVNVYPDIEADFVFDYDTCVAGPVVFTDQSSSGSGQITNWSWDFASSGASGTQNPRYQFQDPGVKPVQLRVTDVNSCSDVVEKEINWFPVPPLIIIEPSTFLGCEPATVTFTNLSSPIDDSYDIRWDFGDGETGDEISPVHVYESPGIYTVEVEITSPIGCYTSARFPNWIEVEPSPDAAFSYSPDDPSSFDPLVRFFDESRGAQSWQWNFDGEAVSFEKNPSYQFRDTGVQVVQLVVIHPSGCPDTAVQIIDVVPRTVYHLPNAFTPNGDGRNDVFQGKGILEGIRTFNMQIFNRWGEQIFETNDPFTGWNGRYQNDGEMSPNGVYVVQVRYIDPRGIPRQIDGFATLIR